MLKSTMGFGFLVGNANCTRLQGVPFGVFINYYDVRSKGHILLGIFTYRFNNYWHLSSLECWKGFCTLLHCCMPLNVTCHTP
jgi:hypothetical protein